MKPKRQPRYGQPHPSVGFAATSPVPGEVAKCLDGDATHPFPEGRGNTPKGNKDARTAYRGSLFIHPPRPDRAGGKAAAFLHNHPRLASCFHSTMYYLCQPYH